MPALTADTLTRYKSVTTNSESVTPNVDVFVDTSTNPDGVIVDWWATINSAKRLLKRFVFTYTKNMMTLAWQIEELKYDSHADDTYDNTDAASALTAPFTLAGADSRKVIGTSTALDGEAFWTLAGDVKSS